MADGRDNKENGPVDRLKSEAQNLVSALGDRALSSVQQKIGGAIGRLTEYVEGGAGPGLMAAVTGARDLAEGKSPGRAYLGAGWAGLKEKVRGMFGKGGKGKGGKKLKVTNIVESIDIGAPVETVYNQWTQFADFPGFMKKVENVDQVEDEKLHWKAQILWSHREWDATILEQVPEDKIVWQSKGAKGHVDGAVTFHALAPNLTRVLISLEYHPQGLFEHTGNMWRAQGRRVRLELKHFRRHVMNQMLQHPDDVQGWRGEIHEGQVASQESEEQPRRARKGRDERAGDEEEPRERVSDEREPDEQAAEGQDEQEEPDERPAARTRRTATTSRRRAPATAGSGSSRGGRKS